MLIQPCPQGICCLSEKAPCQLDISCDAVYLEQEHNKNGPENQVGASLYNTHCMLKVHVPSIIKFCPEIANVSGKKDHLQNILSTELAIFLQFKIELFRSRLHEYVFIPFSRVISYRFHIVVV